MISPFVTPTKHVLAAEKPYVCELTADPAMHPLASEEWLGSRILAALTDPRVVCELALVNKNFSLASNSNLVWQKFLPPTPQLKSLLETCGDKALIELASCSKKELYFRLCKSISLDGGLKRFWLDQRTGGECYMLSARSLKIYGSIPQNWQWLSCPGAWFPKVAVLKSVRWIDIGGRFRQLLKPGSYVVSYRMQMRSPYRQRSPIKVSLQNVTSAQPLIESVACFNHPLPISEPPLTSPLPPNEHKPSASDSQRSESNQHVWVECDVGRFTVEEDEDGPTEVTFSIHELEVLGWEGGFVLDGVLIRPDYVVDAKDRSTPCTVFESLVSTGGCLLEAGLFARYNSGFDDTVDRGKVIGDDDDDFKSCGVLEVIVMNN